MVSLTRMFSNSESRQELCFCCFISSKARGVWRKAGTQEGFLFTHRGPTEGAGDFLTMVETLQGET